MPPRYPPTGLAMPFGVRPDVRFLDLATIADFECNKQEVPAAVAQPDFTKLPGDDWSFVLTFVNAANGIALDLTNVGIFANLYFAGVPIVAAILSVANGGVRNIVAGSALLFVGSAVTAVAPVDVDPTISMSGRLLVFGYDKFGAKRTIGIKTIYIPHTSVLTSSDLSRPDNTSISVGIDLAASPVAALSSGTSSSQGNNSGIVIVEDPGLA